MDWKLLGEMAHEVDARSDETDSLRAIKDTLEDIVFRLSTPMKKLNHWEIILLLGELWLLIKIAHCEKDQQVDSIEE